MILSDNFEQRLANAPKPTGRTVPKTEIICAKWILQKINNLSGIDDHTDSIAPPPTTQEPPATVYAVRADSSVSRVVSLSASRTNSQQLSSKGDKPVSKLTGYLKEHPLLSSSSGLNMAFILITSQSNKLQSQNTKLQNQVNHYQTEVDCLEKKLEKFRKKVDMTDLVTQLTNHSLSPWPSSTLGITQHMPMLSASEGFSFPQILPPTPAMDLDLQMPTPAIGEGAIQGFIQERVT